MTVSRYYSSTAVETTLVGSLSTSDTTMQVASNSGYPVSFPFTLIIDQGTASEEIVEATAYTAPHYVITRAVDGSTARTHNAGATVAHGISARDLRESREHEDDTSAHGVAGAVVGTTDTQTLTNKTIDGDSNTLLDIPASAVKNRPITTQSGSGGSAYSFVLADARRWVLGSSGSTKTFTIPLQATVTWLDDAAIPVTNTGAGVLTLAIAGGGTLNGADLTLAQGESAVLLRTASDVWWCLPFSTGSAAPRATYSGTTGSPSVDTSARPGKTIIDYTGSGSITIATAGLVECRVFAGGGGGGKGLAGPYYGGGGGAGAHFETTLMWLDIGTHTITVGAGGAAAVTNSGQAGNAGNSSRVGPYAVSGGGGGGGIYGVSADATGGSGGGTGNSASTITMGTPPYGNNGGNAHANYMGGGGGGAGAIGGNAGAATGGVGGAGVASSITGSSVTVCGGGGGGGTTGGAGGSGGGGTGMSGVGAVGSGAANSGSGGGGGGADGGFAYNGGAGGSGRVIIVIG
jgi:hypothetical protein